VLIAASGLYLGNQYTRRHRAALQEDTSWLRFQEIASSVNALNEGSGAAVLTDLGPHLAYHLDAHTYLDTEYGNYWRRAFALEHTFDELSRLGIRLITTKGTFDQWVDEHNIPPEAKQMFTPLDESIEGVLIIKAVI
jgi:hypothetical protein